MSIVAYTGLPGSGKSYGVVENVIIPALKAGRHVITNMPVDVDALIGSYPSGRITKLPEGVTAADIAKIAEPGCILVLDEAWRYWKAGQKDHMIPDVEKELFAMHRHKVADGFSMEIVLVTQDLAQVAMFLRALVEQTFRSVKLTAIGSKNKFRIDVYEGPVTGPKPPAGRKIRSMYGKYKPEIYRFYKSHTQSDGGAGAEEKADDRGNMLKGWRFKISVIAICVAPALLWFAFHEMHRFSDKVTKKADLPDGSQSQQNALPPVPAKPSDSKTWRLVGKVIVNETVYFLLDSEGGQRRVPLKDCNRDLDLINWRCQVDGEMVAEWTGKPPPIFNQVFGAPATPQAIAANQ